MRDSDEVLFIAFICSIIITTFLIIGINIKNNDLSYCREERDAIATGICKKTCKGRFMWNIDEKKTLNCYCK
jgi:hypothetical protein